MRRRRLPLGVAEPARLAVVGEGTADGVPDQCVVHAALHVVADSVADAVSQVGALSSQVSASLRTAGLSAADLRTTNLDVHDVVDQGKQTVTARVATYHLEITVRPLAMLDRCLTSLVAEAGDALQVRALRLAVSDPEPLRREARARAMHDARVKATELAQTAGGRLGRIVSVEEESPASGRPYRGFATRGAAPGPPVATHLQVEPGGLAVGCRVAVTYELTH